MIRSGRKQTDTLYFNLDQLRISIDWRWQKYHIMTNSATSLFFIYTTRFILENRFTKCTCAYTEHCTMNI